MMTPNRSKPQANNTHWIRQRIQASIDVKQAILASETLLDQILRVGNGLADRLQGGGQALLFGNGGSAADAQHIAGELVGRLYLQRRALPALALTVNSSVVTAIGNDENYTRIFARQIEAHARSGDAVIGLSTSGTSANVIQGLVAAKELGCYTVALVGSDGHALADLVDECICIPSSDVPRIQESHIMIGHILCDYIEQCLFG
ncbi:MAG: SIS domain-containing protein [Chloroflexi bacterium]|nr:SIS domain-containing protein [Chloroflexota bacterium]